MRATVKYYCLSEKLGKETSPLCTGPRQNLTAGNDKEPKVQYVRSLFENVDQGFTRYTSTESK